MNKKLFLFHEIPFAHSWYNFLNSWVLFRNFLFMLIYIEIYYHFSLQHFRVLGLALKSLFQFELLFFVQIEKHGFSSFLSSSLLFLYLSFLPPSFPSSFFPLYFLSNSSLHWKVVFFPMYPFDIFFKKTWMVVVGVFEFIYNLRIWRAKVRGQKVKANFSMWYSVLKMPPNYRM